MEQQTYSITAPNGKTLEVTGDHMPTEPELREIFAKAGVDAARPLPETRMPAGVPARGRGTQLDLDKSNRGAAWATTPLAEVTGVPAIDGFTSPVGLGSLALGGASVLRAAGGASGGLAASALAAVKQLGAEAAPQLKYEIAKQTLEYMGVPGPVAMPTAMLISGYRGNGKKATAPVEPPAAATPAKPSAPVNATGTSWAPGTMPPPRPMPTSAPMEAPPRTASGGTPPPSGPPAVAAPVSTPPPATPAAAVQKAMLSAPEVLEFDRLRAAGKTESQAYATIRATRDIRERFGLKIPTKAETRFPKGNRGGPPKDE